MIEQTGSFQPREHFAAKPSFVDQFLPKGRFRVNDPDLNNPARKRGNQKASAQDSLPSEGGLGEMVTDLAADVADTAIYSGVDTAIDSLSNSGARPLLDGLGEVLGGAKDVFGEIVGPVIEGLGDVAGPALEGLGDAAGKLAEGAIEVIAEAISHIGD